MAKDISELTNEEKMELARKAQAAYTRERRRKDPEKAKEQRINYWAKRGLALEEAEKHES